ncbi:MAG: hypothetical protein IBX55_21780 [Methyloprofundus sp.]|nr:hypothetical protein [Methyloprofundus sp.]
MMYYSNTPYETLSGQVVMFEQDDTGVESPRDWDNLGKLMLKGGRYIGHDEHPFFNVTALVAWSDGMGIEDAQDFIARNDEWLEKSEIRSMFAEFEREIAAIRQVYRYEHSGVAYNTTGFSCRWDSGKVGVIFALKSDVRENFNVKRISRKLVERVEKSLDAEIETYSQWANGDVYGIKLFQSLADFQSGHDSDSCWGFYFDGNYDFSHAVKDHFGVEIKGELNSRKAA